MKKFIFPLLLVMLLIPFTASAEAYPTAEEAALYLRQQLEQRAETISLEFATEEPMDAPYAYLMQLALDHTGVPTQGDYLRWHMKGYSLSLDTQEADGLTYYTICYTPVYYSTAQEEALLDDAIAALLDELALTNLSDYNKALAIYTYICANVTYDDTAGAYSA